MYQQVLSQQQQYFSSGITKNLSWRKQQLKQLQLLLSTHESELLQALQQDLGKPVLPDNSDENCYFIQILCMIKLLLLLN